MNMETICERDKYLEKLWEELGNIPVDGETECIEEQFLAFPIGTHREEIWKWFDDRHSKGVGFLMYHNKPDKFSELANLAYRMELCPECMSTLCVFCPDGICMFPVVYGRKPKLTEDGCEDCTIKN